MKRHPRCAAGDVEHGVENRPVRDGVASIAHCFGFPEWRGDASCIEVIAADHDWRGDLARRDEIVDCDPELCPFPLPQPADPRRQPLKLDPVASQCDPAPQMLVFGKELEHQLVRAGNVTRIARERDPPERSASFTKERTYVLGDKSGNLEGVLDAGVERDCADVVSIVEGDRAHPLQLEHSLDMHDSRSGCELNVPIRICSTKRKRFVERHARRDVTDQHVVSAGLVGENVGDYPAAGELRKNVGGVANEAHRKGRPRHPRLVDPDECLIDARRFAIAIARRDPLVDPRFVDFHREHHCTGHRGGQRLRASHPSQPRSEDKAACERSAEMTPGDGPEGLVRPLNDSL